MKPPLQPGLFIDGRGRICELREVGGTWQNPSTTTEPQCLTYPPERLYTEAEARAQVEAARREALNHAADEIRRSPWALANPEQMLRDWAAEGAA